MEQNRQVGTAGRELLSVLEANFATHASWIQERSPIARIRDEPEFLLVDSGLPADSFNLVCSSRLDPARLAGSIARALAFFAEVGRPFSWWVGPLDEPPDLGRHLAAAGLAASESQVAMALPLAALAVRDSPGELRVARVRTREQLGDFARIVAANWDPADPVVLQFYGQAEPLLAAGAPLRLYVGYAGGEPVAASELCLGGGVAGLYNVSTRREHRRKGYGYALTQAPLLEARREGLRTGVLQASRDGLHVYRRMGFVPVGSYTEYKPGAS